MTRLHYQTGRIRVRLLLFPFQVELLYDALKRNLLVCIRVQCGLPHILEQLAKG